VSASVPAQPPGPRDGRPVATSGPVLIIGTGLLGTSLGLALSGAGVDVWLSDISPTSLQLAVDMGAGRACPATSPPTGEGVPGGREDAGPSLVVVATPPDVAGTCAAEALAAHPGAVVTDVSSVKEAVARDVLDAAERSHDPSMAGRYVGSHPMAGRERSGAGSADADLFFGRPWVVVAHRGSDARAVLAVRTLATDVGAVPLDLDARAHDQSVALVSHVPQLVSSLLAARLAEAPSAALALAGQGLRDMTRIAASDPRLWTAIIGGNAGPVADVLHALRADLDGLVAALDRAREQGPLLGGSAGAVNHVMAEGNRGVARIPGKHGGAPQRFAEVEVLVPDRAGELGRLFGELGEIGVNIEDLTLDHSAGQRVGVARVMVDPLRARDAEIELERRGWRIIAHATREEGQ
jgi:prephenate dehydrogenase